MRVRPYWPVAVAVALASLGSGCGSGSNMVAGPDLKGSYAGPFVAVVGAVSQTGTMAVVVGPDSRLAGTVQNPSKAVDGTIAGEVDRGLGLEAALSYPGETVTLRGKIAKTTDDHLVGMLTQYDKEGHAFGSFSIDLSPVVVVEEG
ncbi:MAG: hypothetical protein FJX72_04255 [Armatimonadetes bacterium]|nr:hypothetical protein [Armatimonadota bacterium]